MNHWWRCWLLGLLVVCSLTACGTKANPAFSCSDTPCTDPNYPYCDIDGSVGGIPEACTAVTCTAGAFQACRGDNIALTCNNSGTSFDEVQCAHGCDAATGCKLCEANQTVCQNGVVASCDASGAQTSTTNCPLGCFEDQPRCRDIDPSNGLAHYLDMVPSPPDLDLVDAHFDVMTGAVTDGANTVTLPSFAVPAPNNGSPIRVFVANNVHITKASISWQYMSGQDPFGPAFALIARGDVTISGAINVNPLAGGFSQPGCDGGHGQLYDLGSPCESSGGGGGANATNGAPGGDVTGRLIGGTKGTAASSDSLVPLRGGCPGGADIQVGVPGLTDSITLGGGAIQISSATKITLNGSINASGIDGSAYDFLQTTGYTIDGGGAGGSILLEAPSVTLGTSAQLIVEGGRGASACTVATATCGLGGKGAQLSSPVGPGSDATFSGVPSVTAGGGGGGWGRIRVNTPTANYTTSNTSVQDGVVTTGLLDTR